MAPISLKDLLDDVMGDQDTRVAYNERKFLGVIADAIQNELNKRKISLRKFADMMGNKSVSQAQKVTGESIGGTVTLRTLFRALDVLDLDLNTPVVIDRSSNVSTEECELKQLRIVYSSRASSVLDGRSWGEWKNADILDSESRGYPASASGKPYAEDKIAA